MQGFSQDGGKYSQVLASDTDQCNIYIGMYLCINQFRVTGRPEDSWTVL